MIAAEIDAALYSGSINTRIVACVDISHAAIAAWGRENLGGSLTNMEIDMFHQIGFSAN